MTALTLVMDRLAQEGVEAVLIKVALGNLAAGRSAEKMGFRAVAVMEHSRVGRRRTTLVHPLGEGLGRLLRERLSY